MPTGKSPRPAPYGGVTVATETITPQMARDMLERNKMNRTIRDKWVRELASLMQAGEFILNGESLSIDSDGQILDGQHRLTACVRANTAFETVVARGLPPAVRPTVNAGVKRSFTDDLTMNGVTQAAHRHALLRKIMCWEDKGGFAQFNKTSYPRLRMTAAYPSYAGAITECLQSAQRYERCALSKGVSPFMYWLLVMRTGSDAAVVRKYLSILSTGSQADQDTVLIRFRSLLDDWSYSGGRGRREGGAPNETYFAVRAWNAWITGQELGRWQLPPGGLSDPYTKPIKATLEMARLAERPIE